MAGVGEHRQRAGEDPADELDREHRGVDRERDPHPAPAVAAPRLERRQAMVVAVAVHAPSLRPRLAAHARGLSRHVQSTLHSLRP